MVDKERFGRFLRSLLGALAVAWLVVALSAPGGVFAFFWQLVAAWILGAMAAFWLVYEDGWASLAGSELFRPALETSTATLAFVLLAIVGKAAATAATNWLFVPDRVADWVWLVGSALALVGAYAAVFLTGPADPPRSGPSG
jgi:hypothetical protein